jgi:hypothetical protein
MVLYVRCAERIDCRNVLMEHTETANVVDIEAGASRNTSN